MTRPTSTGAGQQVPAPLEQLDVLRECCVVIQRLAAEPYGVGWGALTTVVLQCHHDLAAVWPEPPRALVEVLARQRLATLPAQHTERPAPVPAPAPAATPASRPDRSAVQQ